MPASTSEAAARDTLGTVLQVQRFPCCQSGWRCPMACSDPERRPTIAGHKAPLVLTLHPKPRREPGAIAKKLP